MALASAGIVGISCCLRLPIPTCTREMTRPTADQGTQQIGVSRIVAAGKLLVVCKLALHQVKLFLRDDSWNLSHGFPLVRPGGRMASMIVTSGSQSRLPMTCSGDAVATKKDRSS